MVTKKEKLFPKHFWKKKKKRIAGEMGLLPFKIFKQQATGREKFSRYTP